MKRKLLSFIVMAALLMQLFCYSQVRAATTASTEVKGSISATILSVSVPATLAFTVDPNNLVNTYISSEASIINNSSAPVQISVGVGNSNFKQSSSSTWKPTDYLPEELDWANLGKTASESSLALGIMISNPAEWRTLILTDTLWVKEQNSMSSPVIFGDLNAMSSAKVTLKVYHGNAFSEVKDCSYDIVWSFSLTN